MTFKDHFSERSEHYRQYRPTYPESLFNWLASITPKHQVAWDCATGTGQSANQLTEHYNKVIATDASPQQIEQAIKQPGIEYRVAPAEDTDIESGSIDLITVAQALHWFNTDAFFDEVDRVLKPGGVLAIWSYKLLNISPAIDQVIKHLYYNTLAAYWPEERQWIEENYQSITMPYSEVPAPAFEMTAKWNMEQLLGYLGTWSAIKRYRQATGQDPLKHLALSLPPLWGNPEEAHEVSWPLNLLVKEKPINN